MNDNNKKKYNTVYTGQKLNKIAFPLGGIGAGMICIEGTGSLSHFCIRNKPEMHNEPCMFSAISIKGNPTIARVIEGPIPNWKIFSNPTVVGQSGNGLDGKAYGLPRFANAKFEAKFPFASVTLTDDEIPLGIDITAWSPFVPNDPDTSSMPVVGLEYRFVNNSDKTIDAIYSFNSKNFLAFKDKIENEESDDCIEATTNGFILHQKKSLKSKPYLTSSFCATVDDKDAKVNCTWFRGGWFDSLTMVWNDIKAGACYHKDPLDNGKKSPGATIFVPVKLAPGEEKTVKLLLSWYTPNSDEKYFYEEKDSDLLPAYQPWYAGKFNSIDEVVQYWRANYNNIRHQSKTFSDCFYDTNLPDEIIEAVSANLSILKSPTILRQKDGRLWAFEGCCDEKGSCAGSCTHVWNYAQSLCHLFPALERTFRQTEFNECQNKDGHQVFRAPLPIRNSSETGQWSHQTPAAADGQLGGIMKIYRDWKICGDSQWLKEMWPKVKQSLLYCIEAWDPEHNGVLSEPHHNTFDIEFWGPDSMCSTIYIGALKAAIEMANTLKEDASLFMSLFKKGTDYLTQKLYNGEYFHQLVQTKGLRAKSPLETASLIESKYSPEAIRLYEEEGLRYQYGDGCLSDGVVGCWLAKMCCLGDILDREKIVSHLKSVYKYNYKTNLSGHANPQRPGFAIGNEGGLLVCSWPNGNKSSMPLIYTEEVWTGVEYQVASHLISMGLLDYGLNIVRTCRDRYDGVTRNPFNEYECGHWYARAMSSYALLQAITGTRYDAVGKILYIEPNIEGDFRSFLCTSTGYGTVGVKSGKPFIEVKSGDIVIKEIKFIN
ncbi:MAG: GH116 family glycosyl hydrolase [Phycisphaerales bacterium]